MEEVVLRKQSPDYDDSSSECSEDGRLLGAPQLLCLLTCGALLSLVGVFITSYGYLVDSSHEKVMRAIGPALLVLGMTVLLICICACFCACHRNHNLPPNHLLTDSEFKPRATFYYDHENVNDLIQNYGSSRVSGMPQGYGGPNVHHFEYPNSTGYVPNQGRVSHQGSGPVAIPGYEYRSNPLTHGEMPASSLRSTQDSSSYRKGSSAMNLADKSGHFGKNYNNEETQQQDAIRFLASTVTMEQNRRKYSGQMSIESNISGNGHQSTHRTPSNNTIVNYPQTGYPSDHAPMNTYPNPHVPSSNPPQPTSFNIVHSHSVHCLSVPGSQNHPGNALQHQSPHPDASLSDDSGVGGLKRTNKMYALNVGFIGDVEDEASDLASGGRMGRDRTLSISGEAPHRLRRNYTVSAAMQRTKNSKRGPGPYHHGPSSSALYRQQQSIPSGSFQQLATLDYEAHHGKKKMKEFVEKPLGSEKPRKKSTKGKKKNGDEDTPIVCPLPSCSDETLKAIGLDIPSNEPHILPRHQIPSSNQDSSIHHPQFNVDGNQNRPYLEPLQYDQGAVPSGLQDRQNPVHVSFSNHNAEYNYNEEETGDSGLRSDGARPSGYSAKNRLSLIPEVHGHGPSPEQENFESNTTQLGEGEPVKDIKERIEEVKEKIEEITREKESVSSGQRRRPSMGIQAIHRT